MRPFETLYHLSVAALGLGIVLGLFVVVAYILTGAVLAFFFGIEIGGWVADNLGWDFGLRFGFGPSRQRGISRTLVFWPFCPAL